MVLGNSGALEYSLFNVLAYGAGGIIFYLQARTKRIVSESLLYIVFAALLGGLIGSRLGSGLFVYRQFYWHHPLAFLSPEIGGKTVMGGLIGGYIGVIAAKKILKINSSTGDLFAPALALGIAIGRIGCFLNGCCYGLATNLPWGVMMHGAPRHPTQLYESIFCFVLFIYLWWIRKKVKRDGDLFKIFLLAYSFFRFWIEFLRADKVIIGFSLSIAQVLSMLVFAYAFCALFLRKNKEAVHAEKGV